MTIEDLIASANELTPPPPAAAGEFEQKRERLAEALNERLLARADLSRLIGEDNEAMMQDNSRNLCRFLSSLFAAYEPEVLVRTVLWVFRAYRSHGFQLTFWAAELDEFLAVLRDQLTSATADAVSPFCTWMVVQIPAFTELSDQQLQPLDEEPPAHD